MITVKHILSRADDETLSKLVGETAISLLMKLDPRIATPANLRQIAINLHGCAGFLLSKEYRGLLIDLLRPNEVEILATILGVKNKSEPYTALKNLAIHRHSERETALFNFFEEDLPQEDVIDSVPSPQMTYPQYSLFPHQRLAVRKVQQELYRGERRVVLHMPTGAGKTRTAMNVIVEHLRQNEPTLVIWLAHSEELCEQAVSEFEKAWTSLGNRPMNVWRFWGSHDLNPSELKDGVVVAGLSKTYNATRHNIAFIVSLAQRTSLVIIDEAHSAIADTYSLILDSLVVQRRITSLLGLTATPGRTWADIAVDEQLAKFFNKKKVTLEIEGYTNPVDYLVKEQYLADVTYTPLFHEGGKELTEQDIQSVKRHLDIPDKILKLIADDEMRNLAIIAKIEQLAKYHQRIIVFAATVEHSSLLASVLHVRGYSAHSVTGNTPKQLRGHFIDQFREDTQDVRILCNFGVLTTGFDAPRTSAVLVARPTKSLVLYSQMVGRAIRGVQAGGNEKAEVVTVVDYQLPGFGSVADAFKNWEDVWE